MKYNQLEPGFTISPSLLGLFLLYFHHVIFNVIEIETAISPSVPARRGGLGLFLLYFHHVIFNVIEIETAISPSVPSCLR